jgi:hypothetical protein
MEIPDGPTKYESASVALTWRPGRILALSNLYSIQERKGHATELMRLVCEYADKHAKVVILRVNQYGKTTGMNNSQLIQFYQKFGFRLIRGATAENLIMRRTTKKE